MSDEEQLRQRILDLVAEYHELAHGPREFVPGTTADVNVSGTTARFTVPIHRQGDVRAG